MSLNIKNQETGRLARQLAAEAGESVTRAIALAVEERLDRLHNPGQDGAGDRALRIWGIANDAAGRWVEPFRSEEHGRLLYGENGLSR